MRLYYKMVYVQQDSVSEKEMNKIPWDVETQMDHQIPARKPDPVIINNKIKILIELV